MEHIEVIVNAHIYADRNITKEQVLKAFDRMTRLGYTETDYDALLSALGRELEEKSFGKDFHVISCSISPSYRRKVIKFTKEVLAEEQIFMDENGQLHLFDPEDYEI